jgi:hypothetical protein
MFFAHPGHWIVNAAYFLPVAVFLVWLIVTQVRERRRGPSAEESQGQRAMNRSRTG